MTARTQSRPAPIAQKAAGRRAVRPNRPIRLASPQKSLAKATAPRGSGRPTAVRTPSVRAKSPVRTPSVRATSPARKSPVRATPKPAARSTARPQPKLNPGLTATRTGTGRRALSAARRDSAYYALVGVVATLCMIGLLMVLSASSVEALRQNDGAWAYFQKQLLWIAVGTAALVATARIDYRRWPALGFPLLVASIVLLVAVLIPGVGERVNGSTRWIGVGMLRFQPSEVAKLAVLLFVADLLARRSDRLDDLRLTLRPIGAVVGVIAGLVLLQPDMGTAMIMVLLVVVMLFVGGIPLRQMVGLGALTMVGAGILAMAAGYRRARLLGFVNPWADFHDAGYQLAQSLVAFGTGNITGIGLGASRAKWGFLPNAHTDFIFAILGEELGLVGTLGVLLLFVAFTVLGLRAALRAPDRLGVLLASGITAWITGQAIINIGAVTGMLPVTGVPLPFVSFGGTSLVVTMGAVGILLNIARRPAARAARTGPADRHPTARAH